MKPDRLRGSLFVLQCDQRVYPCRASGGQVSGDGGDTDQNGRCLNDGARERGQRTKRVVGERVQPFVGEPFLDLGGLRRDTP